MSKTAAVLTISDKGAAGLREDTSGPALVALLEEKGFTIVYRRIIADEFETIAATLKYCSDQLDIALVVTTGGTGFSPRDVTPEATLAVVERTTPGLPEAMRAESMKITPHGMLSRAAAGIRGGTLIVNFPGSKKAASECLAAVLPALDHGIEILRGEAAECGNAQQT